MAADPLDLCLLAEVRDYLQKATADTAQDALIQALITRASVAIMSATDREFAPLTTDATRTFRVDPSGKAALVNLAPYDLRSVISLTLSPESGSPTTLVATTDYTLEPLDAPNGVYNRVRLSYATNLSSDSATRFGYARIAVRGAWGFPVVPLDVKQACIDTVFAWMRGNVQAYSSGFNPDVEIAPPLPQNLPLPARWKLAQYQRMVV